VSEFPAGSQQLLSSLNTRAILELVDELGPVARPEITAKSGLSKTAVARILVELERSGIVSRVGTDTERRGPAAAIYAIEREYALAGAAEIGHHYTRAAIVDLSGRTLGSATAHSARGSTEETATLVEKLLRAAGAAGHTTLEALNRVVVAVPAAVARDGSNLTLASGLPNDGAELTDHLHRRIPVILTFENDTNLAALAEARTDPAASADSFALISVGASVGVGIVIDKRLYRGHNHIAGEVAYLPRFASEEFHGTLPSGLSLPIGSESIAADASLEGVDPALSAHDIFDLARSGDANALAVTLRTARRLAQYAATIALVLDPEFIVLGGSIGSNVDLLAKPVRDYLAVHVPEARSRVIGTSAGVDPVLRGACLTAASDSRDSIFAAVCNRPGRGSQENRDHFATRGDQRS